MPPLSKEGVKLKLSLLATSDHTPKRIIDKQNSGAAE